jgi:hypothetical protein
MHYGDYTSRHASRKDRFQSVPQRIVLNHTKEVQSGRQDGDVRKNGDCINQVKNKGLVSLLSHRCFNKEMAAGKRTNYM